MFLLPVIMIECLYLLLLSRIYLLFDVPLLLTLLKTYMYLLLPLLLLLINEITHI